MTTNEAKESPLRSLSSFKAEIPGGDGLATMDTKKSSKSLHQYLDMVVNGAIFLSLVVFLVLVICLIVAVELLISFDVLILYGTDNMEKEKILKALSATTLAILALFVLEIVGRLFSMGTFIKSQKMEIFDVIVIAVAFVTDLVFLASGIEESLPATRSVTLVISLRLWRVYGIYQNGVSKAREESAAELHMEKYARSQAEIQADALQAQCDQQLKEIAHLRDYMRQHGLDPDSPKLGYPVEYRHGYRMVTPDFDKADTVRVNDRVNSESSLASAIATFESTSEVERRGEEERRGETSEGTSRVRHQIQNNLSGSPSSTPSSSSTNNIRQNTSEVGHTNQAFEIEVGEEAREQSQKSEDVALHHHSGMEGITNPAFEDDHHGDEETGEKTVEPSSGHSSPSSNNNADDEAQLRMELDELRRMSDAAMLEELGATSTTQEINGVPTTSL